MHVLDLMKDTEMECQSLDAEILRIQERLPSLQNNCARCPNLGTKILQVQERLLSLQNKRSRYASHMEKLRTALTPCKDLPAEILAEIFIQCLDWRYSLGRSLIISAEKWQYQNPLPAPWILGHVCSKWRQIALGEKRLWNSISFAGKREHHLEMLEEAFKHGGRSALRLEAREFPSVGDFLSVVVCPQSCRISSLFLHIYPATYRDFLRLPSGLFNELVCVELWAAQEWSMCVISTATVFQNAPRLRRATLPSSCGSLLPLVIPWHQLTYLDLCPHFDPFLEVISLCTNLQECRINLPFGRLPTESFPPAGIQLPHLRKLRLHIQQPLKLLYSDFFRPLVLPNLEELAIYLCDTPDKCLPDLRQAIEGLFLPDLLLEVVQPWIGDIVQVARFFPLTTIIKASQWSLFESDIDTMSHDPCFQKLTSLEMSIRFKNMKAFIEMLRVQWSHVRQQNTHLGIRSTTIHVLDAREEDISRFSLDIREVQKQLGILDSQIIFLPSR